MGFLSIKSNSIYLTVETNAKLIRPLNREAMGKWARTIPACKAMVNGKLETVRRFTMCDADFSKWFEKNLDPLWDQLAQEDKFNRSGARQDFALRPQHILPVWSYSDNDVKIIKQGNQFFEEMSKFDDQGHDVTTCDWMCWFEGGGRTKKYRTMRQDAAQFNLPIPMEQLQQKVTAAIEQAFSDLLPWENEQEMIEYLHGDFQSTEALPNSVQPQGNMPSYTPGGSTGVSLGGAPALPPMQQQIVQPTMPPQVVPQMPPQQQVGNGISLSIPGMSIPSQTAPQMPPQVAPQMPPGIQVPVMMPNQQSYNPAQQVSQAENINIPNAPVQGVQTFAPPATTMPAQAIQEQPTQTSMNDEPGSTIVDVGKYKGKGVTLAWIAENDPKYITYLRGNKKEYEDEIDAMMAAGVGGNALQSQLPLNDKNNETPAAQMSMSGDHEELRSELVKRVNEKIMQIPDFQGQGILSNMMPFLEQTIGTTSFSEASLDQLQKLDAAINARIGA